MHLCRNAANYRTAAGGIPARSAANAIVLLCEQRLQSAGMWTSDTGSFAAAVRETRSRWQGLERAKGIEPSYAAWEAAVLPLNYARDINYLDDTR